MGIAVALLFLVLLIGSCTSDGPVNPRSNPEDSLASTDSIPKDSTAATDTLEPVIHLQFSKLKWSIADLPAGVYWTSYSSNGGSSSGRDTSVISSADSLSLVAVGHPYYHFAHGQTPIDTGRLWIDAERRILSYTSGYSRHSGGEGGSATYSEGHSLHLDTVAFLFSADSSIRIELAGDLAGKLLRFRSSRSYSSGQAMQSYRESSSTSYDGPVGSPDSLKFVLEIRR